MRKSKNIKRKTVLARGSFQCKECEKCLKKDDQLEEHIKRAYVKYECDKIFNYEVILDKHKTSVHHRKTIRGFLHLSDRAPVPSLYFLTGELPIEARLHRDIFSLFYNIWINPDTKIYSIVRYLLEHSSENSRTWSRHIKNLAQLYQIEDPLECMKRETPQKAQFSEYILTKITVFYENELRLLASKNSKMKFLNVGTTGLRGCHHPALFGIFTTENVSKLRPHIKMLCDDLYTYEMKSKYQEGSPHCRLCQGPPENSENLIHILTSCQAYSEVRSKIFIEMNNVCEQSKSQVNFLDIRSNPETLTQFILDCTSLNLPSRISNCDDACYLLFTLSRDLCYHIYKTRLEKLKNI